MKRGKILIIGVLAISIFGLIYIPFVPLKEMYPKDVLPDGQIYFDCRGETFINYKTAFFLHKGKHFRNIPCIENGDVHPTEIVFNWNNSISIRSDVVSTVIPVETINFGMYIDCPEGAYGMTSPCTWTILCPDSLFNICDAIYFYDTKGNELAIVKKLKDMHCKDLGFKMKIDGKTYRTGSKESIFDYK